ncbi:hypothetical protein TNCV_4870451 [Trichonephila clavipes]|nr:hypothetical protein TNCV_4870451 [Trichonephila clavipes]
MSTKRVFHECHQHELCTHKRRLVGTAAPDIMIAPSRNEKQGKERKDKLNDKKENENREGSLRVAPQVQVRDSCLPKIVNPWGKGKVNAWNRAQDTRTAPEGSPLRLETLAVERMRTITNLRSDLYSINCSTINSRKSGKPFFVMEASLGKNVDDHH